MINRQQWIDDCKKSRANYVSTGRKLVKINRHNSKSQPKLKINNLYNDNTSPEVRVFNAEPKTQINPFPFNRQHKSKVIYRNLGQPIVFPTYAGSKTFSHQAKNN
jgi:hypothetical protein